MSGSINPEIIYGDEFCQSEEITISGTDGLFNLCANASLAAESASRDRWKKAKLIFMLG